MANTYLIKDSYFKEQYPMHNDLDMAKFYSVLLIEQKTTIEDWIGSILYKWLMANAASITDGDTLDMLNNIQYALVFLTAQSLIKLANTPKENKELALETVMEKVDFMKAKVIAQIVGSEDIQLIIETDGGTSDNNLPDVDEFRSPIYFYR